MIRFMESYLLTLNWTKFVQTQTVKYLEWIRLKFYQVLTNSQTTKKKLQDFGQSQYLAIAHL